MTEKQYKDNSGAFFRNKNKSENDNRPHYTGNLSVNGEKMFISVWKKTSQKGNEYLSFSASKPNTDYKQKDPDPDNNRGALFFNDEENKDYDISGKVKLNGEFYFLKVLEKGNGDSKFFVFNIEPSTANKTQNTEEQSQDNHQDNYNQTIPFDEENSSQDSEQKSGSESFNIFTMGNT